MHSKQGYLLNCTPRFVIVQVYCILTTLGSATVDWSPIRIVSRRQTFPLFVWALSLTPRDSELPSGKNLGPEGEESSVGADWFTSRITQLTSMLTLFSRAIKNNSSVELLQPRLQQPHPMTKPYLVPISVGGVSDVMCISGCAYNAATTSTSCARTCLLLFDLPKNN